MIPNKVVLECTAKGWTWKIQSNKKTITTFSMERLHAGDYRGTQKGNIFDHITHDDLQELAEAIDNNDLMEICEALHSLSDMT